MAENSVPEDKIDAGWVDCGGFFEGRTGSLGGAETPIVQYPPHGVTAPENEGLGRTLNRNSLVRLEMHSFNFTDTPVLREAWLNVHYRARADIQQWVGDVNMLGGFNIATPPGAREIMKLQHRMTNSARVLNLYGHGHSHMRRFSAWLERSGERTLLLEDYDWQHPAVLLFDSVTENLLPERSQLRAGGHTGMLNLETGDVLAWECEVENTTDSILRYRNEVETGEMCNLFGEYVGNGGGLGNQALAGEVVELE